MGLVVVWFSYIGVVVVGFSYVGLVVVWFSYVALLWLLFGFPTLVGLLFGCLLGFSFKHDGERGRLKGLAKVWIQRSLNHPNGPFAVPYLSIKPTKTNGEQNTKKTHARTE